VESIWASFRLDPRESQHAALRASDADRALVSSALADAYADGRLTASEYDERESANLSAKTLGQLPPLLVDLVGPTGLVQAGRAGTGDTGDAGGTDASGSDAPALRSPRELHREAVRQHLRSISEAAAASSAPFLICLVIWLFTTPGDYFWPMWVLIPVLLATGPLIIGAPAAIHVKQRRLERRQDERLRALPSSSSASSSAPPPAPSPAPSPEAPRELD
jgi:hypothetical protein